jgi:hypothetical protein
MTSLRFGLLAALLLAGCHTSLEPPPSGDLGAKDGKPASPTKMPDLGGADFASFCAGSSVAGTCAVDFFGPLESCFSPEGSCTEMESGDGSLANYCWSTGAKLVAQASSATEHATFSNGGQVCYSMDVASDGMTTGNSEVPLFTITANGATLRYDYGTGAVTCPDGSMTNIGSEFGGCLELQNLLSPVSIQLSPDEPGACVMGSCQ